MFLLLDILDKCLEENDDRKGMLKRIKVLILNKLNLNFFITSRELS